MDSIVDDEGERLVENIRGTSWNAIWAGFRALQKTLPDFDTRTRKVIEVIVVGAGPVGRFAAEAATKYGDEALHRALLLRGVPGVIVHLIGRNITQDRPVLLDLMSRADMFVDATFRSDPTDYIFPNDLIGVLPEHAVVVDVTADPYITETDPIQVKAIEGIPTGDLDEYEFPPDHPAFDTLPDAVNTEHRRTTVSCYSWPGLNPKECMRRYGRQVGWMLDILLRKPYDELSVASTNYLERALYRGTLHAYLERQEVQEEQ
jgi:alanine dehydrogenase